MYINSNGKADTLRRNMKENESMKKWIALTLALVLALSLFAGCGKGADADETDYASMSIEELKPAEDGHGRQADRRDQSGLRAV